MSVRHVNTVFLALRVSPVFQVLQEPREGMGVTGAKDKVAKMALKELMERKVIKETWAWKGSGEIN